MLPLARTTTALAAAAALLAPAAAHAQAPVGQPPAAPRLVVERPTKKLYVREGAAGRYLLGGTWYFRLDDAFQGDPGRWWSQRSLAGWAPVRVPYDWNARDTLSVRGVESDLAGDLLHNRQRRLLRTSGKGNE